MANIKSTKKNAAGKSQAEEFKASNADKAPEQIKLVKPKADPDEIITVYNGFQGRLVYVSPRTKELYRWSGFGETQGMELRELINAKSSAKKFFVNNWFMFDEESSWVIEYLGVADYYKNALQINNFDSLFSKTPKEIEETISKLSEGQKKSVMYRAQRLYEQGEIDSNKAISALEKSLGIKLSEK